MVDPADVTRPPIRLFLLDDHEIVRRGITELLSRTSDIEVVGEASTVAQALTRIPACRPDVAVLDARLPDGSGIDLCREVRSRHPATRCLVLTSYDDDEALFAAVLAGASGYLLKQIRGSSLTDAIRAVAAGQSLIDPLMTGKLLERLRRPPEPDSRISGLSERELEILDLIAEGLSNREIGQRLFLAEKTVKNYISSLLSKLKLQRRTQAAVLRTEVRHDESEARG
ncbi:response regulator [Microlunatus antarcticus]|uniref:Two-component system response regulator DevR n=1 Tax=Microlunatus antarcticus TaxID=53388 RepID=A0A7W5JV49_9ACTN|nr:response regulator transcription factor [Microlunatus antarcticus]MBB3326866.1 two-component system response regulator DevR [Microlunatus antarcticus]